MAEFLEFEDVSKSFGAVKAVDHSYLRYADHLIQQK